MTPEVVLLIAEDDEGHAELILRNLRRAGIANKVIQFPDGQEVLDFFLAKADGPHYENDASYLLLLDIRMPRVDGLEVLRRLKKDRTFASIPVTMITTTDDPRDITACHDLGCSSFITKPVDYDLFVETIQALGHFLKVVTIPALAGARPVSGQVEPLAGPSPAADGESRIGP
jgi:CheY-like chemotaxis protein